MSYQQNINKVLAHIKLNLDQELNLEKLAKIAGISSFHFHRIFKGFAGETVAEHVLRKRMEEAIAFIVKAPERSVLEIALTVGYNNASAFSRVFKKYFGFSPSDVKSKKKLEKSKMSTLKSKYGKAIGVNDLYLEASFNKETALENPMKVQIKNLEKKHVVGLASNYTHDSLIGAWVKLHDWYEENKSAGVDEWNCIGKYFDDPAITAPDKCKAENFVVVKNKLDLKEPFICNEISEGKYAVARYNMTEEDKSKRKNSDFEGRGLNNFIQQFYKVWLLKSGHEADNYPLMMAWQVSDDAPKKTANNSTYFDVESVDVMLKLV